MTRRKKGNSRRKTWPRFFSGGTNAKPMNCAPAVDGKKVNENSCFTPEIMIKLKAAYNNTHRNDRITSENPSEIWKIMHDKLSNGKCGKKEDCWLDSLISNEEERKKIKDLIFRPKQPKEWKDNPDEWLSNYDIFDVAKQYEVSHPELKIIAPTSIDFDTKRKGTNTCVSTELCKFDLKHWTSAPNKKTKFGIVFNLDKHNEPGSHWVSLWIDVTEKVIVFFDSAANGLPKEVDDLIKRVVEQGKKMNIDFTVYENGKHEHQKGNTECGMYSLFFLITMLTGKLPEGDDADGGKSLTMKERIDMFMKGNISDETVFDYRDLYFNPQ